MPDIFNRIHAAVSTQELDSRLMSLFLDCRDELFRLNVENRHLKAANDKLMEGIRELREAITQEALR